MDITGFLSFFSFVSFLLVFFVCLLLLLLFPFGGGDKAPKILTTTTKNKFYSFYSQCTFKKNRDNRDMYFPATIYHW